MIKLSGSASTIAVNPSIANTAPTITMTDTTASAKSLTETVDANMVNFAESSALGSPIVTIDLANARVGINNSAPTVAMHIKDQDHVIGSDNDGTIDIQSTDTGGAANKGASIGLGGNDGSSFRGYGLIKCAKENASVGNATSYMAFGTRIEGANIVEVGRFDSGGNLILQIAGKGLRVKEGSNAKMGTATLNGTTEVTISNTSVTATSRIFLTIEAPGGTIGSAYVSSRSAGVSFGVKSTAVGDTSTVAWLIIEPS